jgi:hypothetical protein
MRLISKIRYLLLWITIHLCLSLPLYGQQRSTGLMYDGVKTKNIYFFRSVIINDSRTKYIIRDENDTEIYEINFERKADSIKVVFYNKKEWLTKVAPVIKFEGKDSKIIISNYEKNKDTSSINSENLSSILFSIDNKGESPFVYLYQFRPLDNVDLFFHLENLPDSVKRQHQIKVAEYLRHIQIESQKKERIIRIKNNMKNFMDSTIKSIHFNDSLKKYRSITLPAEAAWQSDFHKKLDTIFYNRFKNEFRFSNEEFRCDFEFPYKGAERVFMDTTRNISCNIGSGPSWFREIFIREIKPEIETMRLPFKTENVRDDYLQGKFNNLFQDSVHLDRDSLMETSNQVITELNKIRERTIPVPTLYTYSFRFKSETKSFQLKYTKDDRGRGKIKILTPYSNEDFFIVKSQEDKFKTHLTPRKDNKYNIEICMIVINGSIADIGLREIIKESKKKK